MPLFSPSRTPARRAGAAIVGVAVLYVLAARAGLMHAVVGSTVTLVWAPSGIALAALLVYGYRLAPGVALGAFIANAWSGVSLGVAASIALGNTLEALVGAALLWQVAGFRTALDRRRDVFALIALAACCSTMVSAGMGVAALALGGLVASGDYAAVWLKWWLGDMMGVLVVTPALLASLGGRWPSVSPPRALELLALVAGLCLTGQFVFNTAAPALHGYYPASLAVFPFVIWGALRFGPCGTSFVTLLIALMAVWGTTHGMGPFVVERPVDSLVRWCAFAIVVAVTGLLLAASVAEQHRIQRELQRSHEALESRVIDRTRELASTNADLRQAMADRVQLEARLVNLGEAQQEALGRELHDGLGQHLTSLALFSAALYQRLEARGQPEAATAARIVDMVNGATATTRAMAAGLYPADLELDGLPAALARLAEQTQAVHGIACEWCPAPGLPAIDRAMAINLYRIAQEAVHNAVKHSRATRLWIELADIGGQHRLRITDNGVGMEQALAKPRRGIGMHSMRYRAALLGGAFHIARHAPTGSSVVVTWPVTSVTLVPTVPSVPSVPASLQREISS